MDDIEHDADAAGRDGRGEAPAQRTAPVMARFVNVNRRIAVYMMLAFRMRDGAPPEGVLRTIGRMEESELPPEGRDIAEFAAALGEMLAELPSRPAEADRDEPGPLLAVARKVFDQGSLGFAETIALDVPAAEIAAAARSSAEADRAVYRIAADVLRNAAEVLRSSIVK